MSEVVVLLMHLHFTDRSFHAQPTFKLVRKGSVLAEMTGADKSTLRKYLQQHAQ